MSTSRAAGWYPDPSGMPDTFRWWDGVRWTHALSPRADAPPPPGPKPVADAEPDLAPPSSAPAPAPAEAPSPPAERPGGSGQSREAGQSGQSGEPRGSREPGGSGQSGESGDEAAPTEPRTASPASSATGVEDAAVAPDAPAGAHGEPPPPGAPGPEYLPPTPPTERPPSGADGAEPAPAKNRQNLRSLLVLVTILAILAGASVLTTVWWPRDGVETTTPPPSGPESTPSPDQPSQGRPPSSPPTRPEENRPSESARLVFEPLEGEWEESPRGAVLSNGFAQQQVTQPDYNGRNDWIAMVSAGAAPPRAQQGSLEERARAVGAWFREAGFAPMKTDVNQVDDKDITVDGRRAHLLVQRFEYDEPALESDSDTVTIVVVDMGEQNPTGVFLASVPDTHRELSVDVDNARRSLRVTE